MDEYETQDEDIKISDLAHDDNDVRVHVDRPLSRAFLRETRRPILHARHFKLSKVGTVPIPAGPKKKQPDSDKDKAGNENKGAIVPVRPASVPPGQAASNALRPASVPADRLQGITGWTDFDSQFLNAPWSFDAQKENEEKIADLRSDLALAHQEQSNSKAKIEDLETQLQEEISHSLALRNTVGQLRELIRNRDREVKKAKHQTALHWKGDVHAKKELTSSIDREEALQQTLVQRDQTIQTLKDQLAAERAEKDGIIQQADFDAQEAALYKQNAIAEHAALKSRLRRLASILTNQVETLRKDQQDVRADVETLAQVTMSSIANVAETSKLGKEADMLALAKEKEAVASAEETNSQLRAQIESLKAEISDLKQNLEDGKVELAAFREEEAQRQAAQRLSKAASKWQHASSSSKQQQVNEKLQAELLVRDARIALCQYLRKLNTSDSVEKTSRMQVNPGSSAWLSEYPGILQLQQDLARQSSSGDSSSRVSAPPEYLVLELVDICQGATRVAFPVFQEMGQRLVERAANSCHNHSHSISETGGRSRSKSETGAALLEFRASPPKDIGLALLEQRMQMLRPYEICFLHGELILLDPDAIGLDMILRMASLEWPMDQLDTPCLFGIREPIGRFSGHGGKPMVILDLTVQGFACEILVSELGSGEGSDASALDSGGVALLAAAYGEPSTADNAPAGLPASALGHCDSWGFSTLHYAAAWGRTGVVRDILNVSPDVALAVDSSGRFAFHRAVENGHFGVALLVAEKVTGAVDSETSRCLADKVPRRSLADMAASASLKSGSVVDSGAILDRLVELLIILSPRLRKVDEAGHSDAEDMRRFWELCTCVLRQAVATDENNINVETDSQEAQGRLLHGVVAAGCPAFAVELLINAANAEQGMARLMGNEIGIPDKEGCTPMDFAASFDDAEAAKVTDCLLRHGGAHSPYFLTVNRSTDELQTALDSLHASCGEERLAELVRYQRSSDGDAALHAAARQQDEGKCFALLRAGANPDAKSNYDETPATIFSSEAGESQTMVEVEILSMDELEMVWEVLSEPLTMAHDVSQACVSGDLPATDTGTPLPKIFREDKLFGVKAEREGQILSANPDALLDGPEVLMSSLGNCGLPITLVLIRGLRRLQAEACGGLPQENVAEEACHVTGSTHLTPEEADLERELALQESGHKPETVTEKLRRLIKVAENAGSRGSEMVKRARQKVAEIELSEAKTPEALGACIANAHLVGVVPPVLINAEVRFAQSMTARAKKKGTKGGVVTEACQAIYEMIEAPSWQKADIARVALGQLKLLAAAASADAKLMRNALEDISRARTGAGDALSPDTVKSLTVETNAAELELTVKAQAGPWADLQQSMVSGDDTDVLRKKVRATQALPVKELKDIGKRALVRAELEAALRSEPPDPDLLEKAIKGADKECTVGNKDGKGGKDIVMVDTTFAKDVVAAWRRILDTTRKLAAASSTAAAPGATGGRQMLEKAVTDACAEVHKVCTEVASSPEVVGASHNLFAAANHQMAEAQLLSRARLCKNDKQVMREMIRTAKASGLTEPARYAREQLARLALMQDGAAPEDDAD